MTRYYLLIPLLWLAFGLRVWQLADLPPGLWYDEAYYAMDAVWLLDGGPWHLFFAGNNGREPLFIYLQTFFIDWLGANPFTPRWVGSLIGMITIPVMYIWVNRLTDCFAIPNRLYLPYLATLGLAISFWHVTLSRGGFRGVLLPLFTLLVFYSFWRGWQSRSWQWFIVTGFMLGITQYTYLAARALPLVFVFFALAWTLTHHTDRINLKFLWGGLLLMALVSATVFAPLGYLFWQTPTLFFARTDDVLFTPDSKSELLKHLLTALRLFIDEGDPNWRHHLPGRPMFGWVGWLGFLPGLWLILHNWRKSVYLFSLVALLISYLPALLSIPPVHALRLSSLLPLYYLIFSLGLLRIAYIIQSRLTWETASGVVTVILCSFIMTIETGLTGYDYFYYWGRHSETYIEYNTPLVELINQITDRAHQTPVLIPFDLYVHPTTRYLLHDHFSEQPPPKDLSSETVELVNLMNKFQVLNVANIPDSSAWVWLTTDAKGQGMAYVSRAPRTEEQAIIEDLLTVSDGRVEPFQDRLGRQLAQFIPIPSSELTTLFDTRPLRTVQLTWGQTEPLIRVIGYDVTPTTASPGQPITLNLYWRSLTDHPFEQRLFLQLIDETGQPINQWEGDAFNEDMYRWRPHGILPTQHTLWLGPDTPDGAYLVRLGFFDAESGVRLPLLHMAEPTDQIQLGLFYVSANGADPRQPTEPQAANFAEAIELVGTTVPPRLYDADGQWTGLPTQLHWRTLKPTDKPYTVFLQLLNEDGVIMTSWDREPFHGLYPTSLWSPDELLMDRFTLPPPTEPLPVGRYRLITGFYDFATWERLQLTTGGDFVQVATFAVQ